MDFYVWITDSPKIQTKGVVYTEIDIHLSMRCDEFFAPNFRYILLKKEKKFVRLDCRHLPTKAYVSVCEYSFEKYFNREL